MTCFDLRKVWVRVRRQDSRKEKVCLYDEFLYFLKNTFDTEKIIEFGFNYDKKDIGNKEGFPVAAQKRSDVSKEWKVTAFARHGEERVYNLLRQHFTSKTCLLISGLREETILEIVQRKFYSLRQMNRMNENLFDVPLYAQEKHFYEFQYRLSVDKLKEEIDAYLQNLPDGNISITTIFSHLADNGNKPPGFDLLSDHQKKSFRDKLINQFKKETNWVKNNMPNKHTASKEEIKHFILRYVITLLQPHSELDVCLVSRVKCLMIMNYEVKC